MRKLSRVYATCIIFVGAFASVASAFALIPRLSGMALLALPGAIAAAWFLRPKMPQGDSSVAIASDRTKNEPWLSKHWKRNLAIVGGFAAVLMVVLFVILGDSDVSRMAIAAAESNPVVKQRLGAGIKRGFFTSGSIEIDGPSGHADLEIPISGPRGKATIYAVAKKSAGIWKFEALDVAFDEASPRVSLLQQKSNTANP